MSEFDVKDYGIFQSGADVAKSAYNNLKSDISKVDSEMSNLNNEDVFMGPLCDQTVSGWQSLKGNVIENISTLNKVPTILSEIKQAYKKSDSANGQSIGSVGKDLGGSETAKEFLKKYGKSAIEDAISWAIEVANDDRHGYSQSSRNGNPNYDCSSLVITAFSKAGIPVNKAGKGYGAATYTGNMKNAFVANGFEWISGKPNIKDLKRGDILLDPVNHTELYIGDGKTVAAHSNYDGVDGDSSGKEINVKAVRTDGNGYVIGHNFAGVLRYKDN